MGDLSGNSTSCVKMSGVYLRKVMKEHPPLPKLSQNMKNPMVTGKKVSKMGEASRHRRQKLCREVLCISLGHELSGMPLGQRGVWICASGGHRKCLSQLCNCNHI